MPEEKANIVIIGAGASGAVAAWSLSKKFSKIICLEQGNWMDPTAYPSTSRNWELSKYSEYHVSPNVRNLPSDYPVNDKNSPIAIANFNAVGGGTILYSAHFPRFHPSNFKANSLDGVADDWPIDYEILEPFFNQNDIMMGVSGLVGDPAYPEFIKLLPPIPMGKVGEIMGAGFNKLNWHWWPSYSAILTRAQDGRERCINLGPCNTGCPQGAKSSVDITYWPSAIRNGVILKTNSRVREIILDNSGKAKGVVYFDENGIEVCQEADLIVLACNGVGTPRILLNSCSKKFPNGLANRSGQVGKNLMLHPLGFVEGIFDENLDSHIGPQGCCIQSQEFYETDSARGFVKGYTMQILRGPGPIETAKSGMLIRAISWGNNHHKDFRSIFGSTIGIGIICEDLPDQNNRVTLDSELKDSNGIPAPKIDYILGENTKKMLAHGLTKGKEVMTSAGANKISAFGPVKNSGWHQMGTARMGLDKDRSVVNQFGQSHDVPNMFIVDSSVFVTSGGVNPVSTMQAIALYISDYISKNNNQINP